MRKLAAIVLLLLGSTAAAHADCPFAYAAPQATGINAHNSAPDFPQIGVGDFDGDGRADLAFDRAIYLGFSKRVDLPIHPGEWIERVTDVNRDGRPDVIAADPGQFIVMVNNGNLTFTRLLTRHTEVSYVSTSFTWGDFNGDGLLDGFVLETRKVFLARGDGTFAEEAGGGTLTNVRHYLVADVNGDHRADLVASADATASPREVYLRNADGFDRGIAFGPSPGGFGVQYIAQVAADFNGDGMDDVLFRNLSVGHSADPVLIYFGSRPLPTIPNLSLPGLDYSTADLNGDGAPDLIGRDVLGGVTTIYLNDHATFRVAQQLQGINPWVVADADGDGTLDLVTTDGQDAYVLHGRGDGTFDLPHLTLAAADSGVSGDFDGDGDGDIALPSAIAWNNGDNTFRVVPISDARMQRPIRAVDVDGDGKAEVISLRNGAVGVVSLRPDASMAEILTFFVAANDAVTGDFTGSHHLELAAVGPNWVQVFEMRADAAPRFTLSLANTPWAVAAADLNGDGKDDLIVAGGTLYVSHNPFEPSPITSQNGYLTTLLSTGSSFGAPRAITLPLSSGTTYGLGQLVTGDFNGDGKADVAAAGLHHPGRIVALYGDGDGGFTTQLIEPPSVENVNHLLAADLDGDGRTDLSVNGGWRIFAGTPGGLVERRRYFTPVSASLRVDDVTFAPLLVRARRDALPWIVTPTQFGPDAYLYRPLCTRGRAAHH